MFITGVFRSLSASSRDKCFHSKTKFLFDSDSDSDSLPGVPLWLAAVYSDKFRPVNRYWVPPSWQGSMATNPLEFHMLTQLPDLLPA